MCGPDRRPRPGMRGAQRGLSIVEVMVAMVVALLVGMAATGAALSFSATQRQAIAAGGAAVNVATALSAIKNDVAAGGLGFFSDRQYNCPSLNLSLGAAPLIDGAPFVPVRITREAPHDRLDVLFASRVEAGANARLRGASNGTVAELDSMLPVAVGDAVLLSPEGVAGPCLVRSVTAVTPAVGAAPLSLAFDGAGAHNAAAFSTAASLPARSRVTPLGAVGWSRYRMVGTNLQMEQPLANASAVVARNVMAFRVQYGTALAGGTALDTWQSAEGASWADLAPADLRRVRGLRIGIVTRSAERAKPDAQGLCELTPVKPMLFGTEVQPDVADWQCYRYRTAAVVVPMRNIVMGAP